MDFGAIRLFTQKVFYLQCLLCQRQFLDGSYRMGSVHPSLCPDVFLELDQQFFLNFGIVLETQINLHDRTSVFCSKYGEKETKLGQKQSLFEFIKKLVFNFYRIGSIMKIYFICFASVLNLYMLKILFLRHGSKCYLPIKLPQFQRN